MKKIILLFVGICVCYHCNAQLVAGYTKLPKEFTSTINIDNVNYFVNNDCFVGDYKLIAKKDAVTILGISMCHLGVINAKKQIIVPCQYLIIRFDKKRSYICTCNVIDITLRQQQSTIFDLLGNEILSLSGSIKDAQKAFDKLDYNTQMACTNIYNDLLNGIDVSTKQYYAQKPMTETIPNQNMASSTHNTSTNSSSSATSSSTTRTYSIEELQALGVIGAGNNQQQVASTSNTPAQQSAPQRVLSDVDQNIPVTNHKAENTFVLIIANEDYQFVDDVDFALNDGNTFKEYCVKTLGVPEKQVWLYENASYGVINAGVSKMVQAMDFFDNPSAIIYYCGHGIPDEKTNDAYIIPTDGNGKDMATCYSLNKLYTTFANTKAEKVTYFMDACFTGASKEGSMLVAARGVAREPKKETLSGKSVVFSATSADETAMAYKEKQHGLFTYFLLKKLQETQGNVSYAELQEYINKNVKKESFLTNEKPQTPIVATSPAVQESWKGMTLK